MDYTVGKMFGYLCGMRRRFLRVSTIASLLLAPALAMAQGTTTESQGPTFRSGAERVTVGATVRDQRGVLEVLDQRDGWLIVVILFFVVVQPAGNSLTCQKNGKKDCKNNRQTVIS